MHPYKVLRFFGENIVTSEFDEWKRYRKIAAPAFNEVRDFLRQSSIPRVTNNGLQRNRKLAFEESVRSITSLYEGEWRGKQEIIVDDATHLTLAVRTTICLSIGRKT